MKILNLDAALQILLRCKSLFGFVCGMLLLLPSIAGAQVDTLRVMQYNLTNYGNPVAGCNTNSLDKKDSLIRRIVRFANPDILACNELNSNPVLSERIRQLVLNTNGVTSWERAATNNRAGSSLVNALFYNSTKLGLKSQGIVNSQIRIIDHYRLYVKPLAGSTDTAFFNILVAHLKAGNTNSDAVDRANMVRVVNTYLATQDTSEGFIFQGDFNAYTSSEECYQLLVNPSQGGNFIDPINRPGAWNNSSSFADVHTQSPRTAGDGCFSGGGMDDRFDQQLVTRGFLNRSRRISYAARAFRVLGNDGRHYNQNITAGTNTSVPSLVLNAIFNNSDHLPIMGKLVVDIPTGIKSLTDGSSVRAWINTTGLHVSGLTGTAAVSVTTLTGAELVQGQLSGEQAVLALPTYLPTTGMVLVHLRPKDARQIPVTLRVLVSPVLR